MTTRAVSRAARQRRYRLRQGRGVVVAAVQIDPAVIAALIASRRISDERSLDRAEVAQEIEAVILRWAQGWQK